MNKKEALFWEYEGSKQTIHCFLCPQNCHIRDGHWGACQTRKHEQKVLYAYNYGEVTSMALDPIEKKPLYHFKPGSSILSVGTFGCNMRCSFCQNHAISQHQAASEYMSSEDLIAILPTLKGNIGLAFTYNEPFMWYEYILNTVKELKAQLMDIKVVLVTNGYINEAPLRELLPYIDAMNIDLKAFTPSFYNKICGAKIEPVLKTIEIAQSLTHVEVTTLMVTGENDSVQEIKELAHFIKTLNPDIPLHLSRYYPNYRMNQEATDIGRILEAQKEAKKELKYVYVGNVVGVDQNTYCPNCQKRLVKRFATRIETCLEKPFCPQCDEPIKIIL